MPLYEYECSKCDLMVEKIRAIRERAHKVTCACGAKMLPTVTASSFQMDPVKPVRTPHNL